MRRLLICLLFISLGQTMFAQDFTFDDPEENKNALIFKPSIGIGTGMFTFFGDITKDQKSNTATLSRVGFNLNISQEITPFLDGGFHFLKGKVGANERSGNRNINFESDISMWGINVSYNFDHFLRKNRDIEPFVTAGIESFEFLSKTDLFDRNDNFYHYWSDGTIRSIDESSPSAAEAVRLQRDFTYETDIRESNLDNFGWYPEKAISFPIGVGVNLYLMRQFSFMIGTNLHLTTTDFVDGITDESIGSRKGDKGNDKFLYSYVSLNYRIKYGFGSEEGLLPDLDDDDLLAFDEDLDGVIDFIDECQGTPEGVEVDQKGCPIDTDKDGIPDYMDLNPFTYDTAVVVNDQVIDMKAIEEWYERWNDSTGSAAVSGRTTDTVFAKHFSDETLGGTRGDRFMVRIGEFSGGLPSDVAAELLSIPDVNTWEEGGITYITVGNYDNVPDALKRQLQLAEEGFKAASIVKPNNDRTLDEVSDKELKGISFEPTELNDPVDEVV
ncbi:MAG: hypothetical protein MRY83_09275 [Flavobacteriales bacterium]|nr:hypothetical protein [Flavobacteriales bacterium]